MKWSLKNITLKHPREYNQWSERLNPLYVYILLLYSYRFQDIYIYIRVWIVFEIVRVFFKTVRDPTSYSQTMDYKGGDGCVQWVMVHAPGCV